MNNLNINFVEPKTKKSNVTILKSHAKIRKNIKIKLGFSRFYNSKKKPVLLVSFFVGDFIQGFCD